MTGVAPPPPAPIIRQARWTIRSVRAPQDAQSARVQAWTCLALFGWSGPIPSAIAILDHLVRNASEFGRCQGEIIEVQIARTENDDLLIERHRLSLGLPRLRSGRGGASRARALAHCPARGHFVLAPAQER